MFAVEIGFIVLYYTLAIAISIKVLLENRDPTKTISYLFVLLFLPLFGLIIYYIFGQNLRKEKLFDRKAVADKARLKVYSNDALAKKEASIEDQLSGIQRKIVRLLINNDRSFLSEANSVELLENGENAFDSMIEAIENAQHHIHLEYYIYMPDRIGKRFEKALAKKVEEGVKVRLIYDDVGSIDLKKHHAEAFRKKGIMAYPFMPVRFPRFTSKINFRNHRKLLLIDGQYAYLGGINIRERYDNRISTPHYWRDLAIKITGDAVNNLQRVFLLNWYFVSEEVINFSEDYFPTHENRKGVPIQIAASGPDSKWASIMQLYFYAISSAKQHVKVCTPYFIPNESMLTALKTTALSGVRVELMIPRDPDSWVAKAASVSFLGELLEAGVHIFIYTKGMLHAKYLMVDSEIVTIGSANMDRRSFEQNFELNAILYDREKAEMFGGIFEKDKEDCYELNHEQWKNRKLTKKIVQSLARLVSPIL